MDTDETGSWIRAERLEKLRKETRKRLIKNIKWTTVSAKVPICPRCNSPMEHELDPNARKLWEWVCSKCGITI